MDQLHQTPSAVHDKRGERLQLPGSEIIHLAAIWYQHILTNKRHFQMQGIHYNNSNF